MVLGVQPVGHPGILRVGHAACQGKDRLNGVLFPHLFKGVLLHCAHALVVHQHVGDHIALICRDGKGLVTVAAHAHAAAGADLAAGTGAGRDGVTGGAAAIAGKAGYDGCILGDVLQRIAAHCAHALAIYGDIGNVIAGISGDGEVLTLAAVHLHCSRRGNAAAGTAYTGSHRAGLRLWVVILIRDAVTVLIRRKGHDDAVVILNIRESIGLLRGIIAFQFQLAVVQVCGIVNDDPIYCIPIVGCKGKGLVAVLLNGGCRIRRNAAVRTGEGIDHIVFAYHVWAVILVFIVTPDSIDFDVLAVKGHSRNNGNLRESCLIFIAAAEDSIRLGRGPTEEHNLCILRSRFLIGQAAAIGQRHSLLGDILVGIAYRTADCIAFHGIRIIGQAVLVCFLHIWGTIFVGIIAPDCVDFIVGSQGKGFNGCRTFLVRSTVNFGVPLRGPADKDHSGSVVLIRRVLGHICSFQSIVLCCVSLNFDLARPAEASVGVVGQSVGLRLRVRLDWFILIRDTVSVLVLSKADNYLCTSLDILQSPLALAVLVCGILAVTIIGENNITAYLDGIQCIVLIGGDRELNRAAFDDCLIFRADRAVVTIHRSSHGNSVFFHIRRRAVAGVAPGCVEGCTG